MAASALDIDPAPATGMRPRQLVEFYVLLPLAVGLFLGAGRIGGYQFVTAGHHMAYMALYALLSWACYGLASKVVAVVLRPWAPPLIAVLLVGHFLGGFTLLWPLRDVLNAAFAGSLAGGPGFGPFWPPPPGGLGSYVAISLQGIAWWLLANWVDFRFRGVPRFGYAPARAPLLRAAAPAAPPGTGAVAPGGDGTEAPAAAGGEPRLVARLPERLRGAAVLALEAEEHYTKVHTNRGSTLLLLRFSDAMAEMEPRPGLQVHRSFWVSRDGVERVARVQRRLVIRLRGGTEVPVSRSFRLAVKSAGLPGSAAAGE
jgi:hypothetical protein